MNGPIKPTSVLALKICILALGVSLLPPSLEAQQDQCRDILEKAVYNEFQSISLNKFDFYLSQILSVTERELKKDLERKNRKLDVPIPVGEAFLKIGASSKEERDILSDIRKTYKFDQKLALSQSNKQWFYSKIISEKSVDAWLECMKVRSGGRDLDYRINGDTTGEFSVTITWVPQGAKRPKSTHIASLALTNVEQIWPYEIQRGTQIHNYTGITQKFRRTEKDKKGAIVVTLEGEQPIQVDLDPIQKTPTITGWGLREDKQLDMAYKANRDGLVLVNIEAHKKNAWASIVGKIDGNIIASASVHAWYQDDKYEVFVYRNSFTMPVKKGESWKVMRQKEAQQGTQDAKVQVYWFPFKFQK